MGRFSALATHAYQGFWSQLVICALHWGGCGRARERQRTDIYFSSPRQPWPYQELHTSVVLSAPWRWTWGNGPHPITTLINSIRESGRLASVKPGTFCHCADISCQSSLHSAAPELTHWFFRGEKTSRKSFKAPERLHDNGSGSAHRDSMHPSTGPEIDVCRGSRAGGGGRRRWEEAHWWDEMSNQSS